MGGLLTRMTLRRSLAQVRFVAPVGPRAAQGTVARVYAQVQRDFGMLAPPVALHSPAPSTLAACWVLLRETLVADGRLDRATKEAVAAAVSLANACPYCVDVHSALLGGLVRGRDAVAIAADRVDAVGDERLRQVAAWARTGRADGPVAPFPSAAAAEVLGVAVTFHYLNRMVTVFLGDSPIPPGVPGAVRNGLLRLIGRVMRPVVRTRREPGGSLGLLPAAPVARNLPWADGSPTVADAFARANAAVGAAGERAVPERVRALVRARLDEWDGRPPGISRAWVDDAVAGLPAAERPAGRLALLTALAPYQVDGSVVDDFRLDRPADRTLVEVAAWASLTTALHVGAGMWAGLRQAADRPAAPPAMGSAPPS